MIGKFEDPRKVFGGTICEIAKNDERVVLLSADSGKSSGFGEFMKDCPERYFEFGIMEQMAIGAAAGMATTGRIPVFCAIAPFVTARPYEMFRNDLGYMRQNAKIVGRNGGISYSDLGSTHHSLDDFAIMRMIPGVTLLNPQDPDEIRGACHAMIEHQGPVYMRIGNGKIPGILPIEKFVIGKGRMIRPGKDITIVSTGTVSSVVIKVANILSQCGIDAEVIGLPTVWPLDKEMILRSASKTRRVVTVEEHYVYGGMGTMIANLLSANLPTRTKHIGIPNTYATSGPYDAVLRNYGLDVDGILAEIEEFISITEER